VKPKGLKKRRKGWKILKIPGNGHCDQEGKRGQYSRFRSEIKKTEEGEYGKDLNGVVCLKFQIYFTISLNLTSHSVKVVHPSRPKDIAHCSLNFELISPNYPI
jgi:hypothetical protein